MSSSKPKPKPHGLILWWSTFYQKWYATEWNGKGVNIEKSENTPLSGSILSDTQLLNRLNKLAHARFQGAEGEGRVVESAYSAVWATEPQHAELLADKKIEWTVCHCV